MRGSVAAWEVLLTTPEKISDDTLYFIYENPEKTEGSLYLGQKLISGHSSGSSVINLNDLTDINIGDNETLEDKQILVYNDTTNQWENTSLSNIINTAVSDFTGATEQQDGIAGLVPQPQAGDQSKFLKGNGTWASINIPKFDTDQVFEINKSNFVSLLGFDEAEIGKIPIKTEYGLDWVSMSPSSLTRQITTLQKLENQLSGVDSEPLDLNAIYIVPKEGISPRDDKYDEYMIINNKIELLGSFGSVNFDDYVTTVDFNAAVDSLDNLTNRVSNLENANFITQRQIGYLNNLKLSEGNNNLIEEINDINDRLTWQELEEI